MKNLFQSIEAIQVRLESSEIRSGGESQMRPDQERFAGRYQRSPGHHRKFRCTLSGMFNFLKGFLLGFIAGCLTLTGLAYTHHVVRTSDGLKLVAKSPGSLDKIYVDMRGWGALDYIANRDVVQALARAGYEQSRQQAQQSLKDSRDALERALTDAQRETEEQLKSVR